MGPTGDEQLLCGMQKLEAVVLMGPRLPGVAAGSAAELSSCLMLHARQCRNAALCKLLRATPEWRVSEEKQQQAAAVLFLMTPWEPLFYAGLHAALGQLAVRQLGAQAAGWVEQQAVLTVSVAEFMFVGSDGEGKPVGAIRWAPCWLWPALAGFVCWLAGQRREKPRAARVAVCACDSWRPLAPTCTHLGGPLSLTCAGSCSLMCPSARMKRTNLSKLSSRASLPRSCVSR